MLHAFSPKNTKHVRVMLPERHQWKPAVHATAVMLRTPSPRRQPVTDQPATPNSHIRRAILRTPSSPASHRPTAHADSAERSHYVIISRDGRKLVTRVRFMLPYQRNPCTDCKFAHQCTTRRHPLPLSQVSSGSV